MGVSRSSLAIELGFTCRLLGRRPPEDMISRRPVPHFLTVNSAEEENKMQVTGRSKSYWAK